MCGFLWIFRIFFCHLPEDRQLGGQSADRRTSIRLCKYFGGVWPRKLTSSAAPGASGDLQPSRFPWERTQSIREPPQYSVPRAGNSRAKHRLRTPRYIIYVCIEKNLKRPCRPRPATNVIIDMKCLTPAFSGTKCVIAPQRGRRSGIERSLSSTAFFL